jgi:hypothetical protein
MQAHRHVLSAQPDPSPSARDQVHNIMITDILSLECSFSYLQYLIGLVSIENQLPPMDHRQMPSPDL